MNRANPLLTPGSVDPLATRKTVCVPGYAKARRPSIWQALKLKGQALRRYGLPTGNPLNWHRFTLDHLVPLELGGMPLDILNVWPQAKALAKSKDRDENKLRRDVCDGTTTLAQAQRRIIGTWSGLP